MCRYDLAREHGPRTVIHLPYFARRFQCRVEDPFAVYFLRSTTTGVRFDCRKLAWKELKNVF